MKVLGIETTCDETAIAVVEDGRKILSNVIFSQATLHAKYGGVFPELASRKHIEVIDQVLEQALSDANVDLDDIDLIAVANKPGLLGSLLVGLNFAKGLSFATNKPFIGVNHVEAHLMAPLMTNEIAAPSLGIVISGGHTALLYMPKMGEYQLIGETQDDAIGEAFDKVATLLGLPYPGGPNVELLAKMGDPSKFAFHAGRVKGRPFDFSFSGLKTAVLYQIKGQNCEQNQNISDQTKKDIAASFQRAAINDIYNKASLASKKYGCKTLLFGGGVSANNALRSLFQKDLSLNCLFPEKNLALDNGAMIASCGYFEYNCRQKGDSYDLEATSRIHWHS